MIACSSVQQPGIGAPETDRPLLDIPIPPAPEPSPNRIRLMNFLKDEYGKRIISGQMDTSWTTNSEMDMIARVFADTGKYPALKGFDLMQLPYTHAPFLAGREQINEAIEWWEGKNNGVSLLPNNPEIRGIVAFCWHWRAGQSLEFYTNRTNFRIPWRNGRLDTESENFQAIIRDLDRVAARLSVLQERDIPVLWRPLHEAAGGWFWWGASGPRPFIALWEFMHMYLTNVKGLNNLIWVWNGEHADWYPNPDTVDIIGIDLYRQNYSSMRDEFEKAKAMAPGRDRMVALTENDRMPDPDESYRDGTMWSWFMVWNDMRFTVGETHRDNFWTGEFHNPQALKEKVYNHPLVITLDKLPDLANYRLE